MTVAAPTLTCADASVKKGLILGGLDRWVFVLINPLLFFVFVLAINQTNSHTPQNSAQVSSGVVEGSVN